MKELDKAIVDGLRAKFLEIKASLEARANQIDEAIIENKRFGEIFINSNTEIDLCKELIEQCLVKEETLNKAKEKELDDIKNVDNLLKQLDDKKAVNGIVSMARLTQFFQLVENANK